MMNRVAVDTDLIRERSSRRSAITLSLIRALEWLSSDRNKVLRVVLISASVILVARILAPFEVGTDQSQQLEAARRLTQGLGLTTTNVAGPSKDLAQLPTPQYLTWWPPGLSLIVAGFLSLGLPMLLSLKIIYGASTLVGWVGWGLLLNSLVSKPIQFGRRVYPLGLLIAAVVPVFFTPLWKGTDIFLWAGIPFVALLLLRTSTKRPYLFVISAGIAFGFLCGMRYSSLFLAPAAFFILLQTSWPNFRAFLTRLVAFALPSFIVILAMVGYLKIFSNKAVGIPEQVSVAAGIVVANDTAVGIMNSLPVTSDLVFGFPLLGQTVSFLNLKPLTYLVGILSFLTVLCLPAIMLSMRKRDDDKIASRVALAISFLPLSLVIFLIATRFITYAGLFGVRRYYEPVLLCGVLIFFWLASTKNNPAKFRIPATVIVMLFAAYLCLYRPALFFMNERRGQAIQSVLGYTPTGSERNHSTSFNIHYPSQRLYTWKENSRLKIVELHRTNPEALFFAQEYPVFVYEEFEDSGLVAGKNFRKFPGLTFLEEAYTSKQLKVFWVVGAEMKLDLISSSNLRPVFYDPVEKTKIYESDFPAGYKFSKDSE